MTSNEYEKQKKLLIETFNKLSSSYKNLFTSDSTQRAKVQSLVNSWNIQRGSKVLEIGGGIGDLSPYLLRKIGTEGELFFTMLITQFSSFTTLIFDSKSEESETFIPNFCQLTLKSPLPTKIASIIMKIEEIVRKRRINPI